MRNEGPIPSLREKYTTSRGDWSGGTGSSDGEPWGNMNSGVIRGAERKILHAPLDLAFAKEGYTASSLTHLLVKYPKNVWVGLLGCFLQHPPLQRLSTRRLMSRPRHHRRPINGGRAAITATAAGTSSGSSAADGNGKKRRVPLDWLEDATRPHFSMR